ncbi:MAG: hypothetical protein RBS07_06090 [Lentimicrobium sp.]|jgi:hypothetical protein|nr:hypothetical protein [Lentimicrobium sp.]
MRSNSVVTIAKQVIKLVSEFKNVVRKLDQQLKLGGQSKSTLNIYIRHIALFMIHFGSMSSGSYRASDHRQYLIGFCNKKIKPLIQSNLRLRRKRIRYAHTCRNNAASNSFSHKKNLKKTQNPALR